MKKVIVNADDFGLSPSVSRAIVECHRRGNVTSTTMFANMPGTEDAARLARENPSLSVGLHFCLTEGQPVAPDDESSLTREGLFRSRGELLADALRGRLREGDIRREFEAQLARLRSLGVEVSHVDGHQHVHMNPTVFRAVLPVINSERIPVRLVNPLLDARLALKRPLKFLKQVSLRRLSRKFARQITAPSNDCLISIHELESSDVIDARTYEAMVGRAKGRDVIDVMVHPYILGPDVLDIYRDELSERMPFLKKCELEYRLLSQTRVFGGSGGAFELTSYRHV